MLVNTRPPLQISRLALALAAVLAGDALLATAASAAPAEQNGEPGAVIATAASTDDQARLKTVTVNARRRTESIQEVPTPITAIDGQTLEEQRVYRVQDIQQLAPSVNVAFQHPRQSSISIRGLGNNPASDGLEGSTGLYIDNVYLGQPGMAIFDLLDVEQIDVLRGPQGTLFGKNTTAGVINITTRKPTFTTERSLETSIAQRGYLQTKASLSGALNDELAGRLSLYRTREDGATENVFNGDKLNGGERRGTRGQLLWNIRDDLDVRLIGEYNEEKSSYGTPTIYSYGPTINGVNRFQQTANNVGATLVKSPFKTNIDGPSEKTVFQGGLSGEVNWHLPSEFTLTSVSAYRWWDFTPENDDGLNVPAQLSSGTSVSQKQWSQEIRLASPTGGAFDYVVGAYYYRQKLENQAAIHYGELADTFFGTAAGAMSNVSTVSDGEGKTDSYALFGQGTLHLSDRTDLTIGLRGTYEEKKASIERYAPVGPAVTGNAATVRNNRMGAYDSGDLSVHGFSPSALVSLSHHFTPDLLGYATLSHGEKSGGVNIAVGSAPTAGADSLLIGQERVNNAELGLKSTLLDGALLLNGNLFWADVSGYQASIYDIETRASYLSNVGGVRSRGAEVEATWNASRALRVNANLAFNDVRYTDYKSGPCAPEVVGQPSCDLTGSTVPGAPKWIANINARYQWELGDLQPYVTGSYAFRSHAPSTPDDSQYGINPSYALVNLSTGLRGDVGDGLWDVSLWLKNAFDKTYYTNITNGNNGSFRGYTGDPRTLGVTARYDF